MTDPVSGSEHCSQDFAASVDAKALELLRNCDLFGILFSKVPTLILFTFVLVEKLRQNQFPKVVAVIKLIASFSSVLSPCVDVFYKPT